MTKFERCVLFALLIIIRRLAGWYTWESEMENDLSEYEEMIKDE